MAEIEVISPETKAMLRRFVELRDARDEAKAAATTAEDEYREAEAEVYEALETGVEGSLKIPLGEPYGTVSFGTVETIFANVINERKLTDHLEQRAMMDEYTKPGLVKGRLNELARAVDEGSEQPVPGLDYYKKRSVRITRPKDKKKSA